MYHETEIGTNEYGSTVVENFLIHPDPVIWSGKTVFDSAKYKIHEKRLIRMPRKLNYPKHIVFMLNEQENLRVHGVQMRDLGDLQDDTELFGQDWVSKFQENAESDSAFVKRLYPILREHNESSRSLHWFCPLQEVAFYGRNIAGFNPLIPDPIRSDKMFTESFFGEKLDRIRATSVRGVHPYHAPMEFNDIADFVTTSGNCYYENEADLPKRIDSDNACSLEKQIEWLLSGKWEKTRFIHQDGNINIGELIDWPKLNTGDYRNGESNEKPSVLDRQGLLRRLDPFRIKILSNYALLRNESKTTSDEGGDCHFGRATQVNSTVRNEMDKYEFCITTARTSTQASVLCSGYKGEYNAEVTIPKGRLFVLQRELRQHPDAVLYAEKRTLCDECDVHDGMEFDKKMDDDDNLAENSVGIMRRMNASRMFASEIRQICLESGAECNFENFEEKWQASGESDDFWSYFLHKSSLIANSEDDINVLYDMLNDIFKEIDVGTDDKELWNARWVLDSGNGDITGSISKQDWIADKFGVCRGDLLQRVSEDPTETFVRSIGMCDMTGPLQTLCTKLRTIQSRIEYANCFVTGEDCEMIASYYSPLLWSSTNKAFSSETVKDFYKYIGRNDTICLNDESSDPVRRAEEENIIIQQQCPASLLEKSKTALQLSRLVLRILIVAWQSFNAIVFDLFLVFFTSLGDIGISSVQIAADIQANLMILIRLLGASLSALVDTLIQFFVNTGSGKVIADAMVVICKIVYFLWDYLFLRIVCPVFKPIVIVVGDTIAQIFNLIKSIPGVSGGVADLMENFMNVWNGLREILENMECKSLFGNHVSWDEAGCSYVTPEEDVLYKNGFVATHCYGAPSYGNVFEDNMIIGCTAGDTCMLDGFGNELGVCEKCPVVDVNNFMRYGCDIFQKRCKCGVPITRTSVCTRNQDCQQNIPCLSLQNPSAYSYGNVDCLRGCGARPICLFRDLSDDDDIFGEPTGVCACVSSAPQLESCDMSQILPIRPTNGLCLYANERSVAQSLQVNTRTISQFSMFAVSVCEVLQRGYFSCQQVQMYDSSVKYLAVGSKILPEIKSLSGRNLLSEHSGHAFYNEQEMFSGLFVDMLENSAITWDAQRTGLCGVLVNTYRMRPADFSITDKSQVQQCVKWRTVANLTMEVYNISGSDDIFLSGKNFMEFLHDHVANDMMKMRNTSVYVAQYYGALRFALKYVEMWAPMEKLLLRVVNAGSDYFLRFNTWINSDEYRSARRYIYQRQKKHSKENHSRANRSLWTLDRLASLPEQEQSHARRLKQFQVDPEQEERLNQLQWDWSVDWTKFQGEWNTRGASSCELFDIASFSITNLWNATSTFYKNGYTKRINRTSYELRDNLINFPKKSERDMNLIEQRLRVSSTESVPENDIATYLIRSTISFFHNIFSFDFEKFFVAFFDPGVSLEEQEEQDLFTLERLVYGMTHCNVERVMLCNSKPRQLLHTVIISTLLLWSVSMVINLSSSARSLFLVLTVPWFIMWYAYGYSPTCFPLIPTCLFGDVLYTLNTTFPAKLEWPALLINQEQCTTEGLFVESFVFCHCVCESRHYQQVFHMISSKFDFLKNR